MNIVPDLIVTIDHDDDGFIVADAAAWEVETPTGTELAPLGWDEDDTIVMDKAELAKLLEPTLHAACEVTFRHGSRPELNLMLSMT